MGVEATEAASGRKAEAVADSLVWDFSGVELTKGSLS